MLLNERDIGLTIEGRTRQLWAEKHLGMPRPAEKQAWTKWYNFLHDQVDAGSRALRPGTADLRPKSPEEPFSDAYKTRIKGALHDSGIAIGAHYVFENACVRVPITMRTASDQLEIYLLGIHPASQNANLRTLEDFLYSKSNCVAMQMREEGFTVQRPKILEPALCGDPGQGLVKTLLTNVEKFQLDINAQAAIESVVERANLDLDDPFNPPARGRFFEPLDAEFLSRKNLSRYLASDKSGAFGFNQPENELGTVDGKELINIEDLCLQRGVEAVAQVDVPETVFYSSREIVACSLAFIPLIHGRGAKAGVPLAAVFSWREDGKLCTQHFHLGDLLSKSKRLERFEKQVGEGAFRNFYSVATNQETLSSIGRFVSGFQNRCLPLERLISPKGYYYNPAQRGASLKAQVAIFGLKPAPRELAEKPEAELKLACLIKQKSNSSELEAHPTLKAILEELSWRNRVTLDLADVSNFIS